MQKILSWKIVIAMKKIMLLVRDQVELMADKVQPNGFKLWLIAWIPRMLYLRLTANELLVDPVNEMAAIGYPASLAGYNWNDVISNTVYQGHAAFLPFLWVIQKVSDPWICYMILKVLAATVVSLVAPLVWIICTRYIFPGREAEQKKWYIACFTVMVSYLPMASIVELSANQIILPLIWFIVLMMFRVFDRKVGEKRHYVDSVLLMIALLFAMLVYKQAYYLGILFLIVIAIEYIKNHRWICPLELTVFAVAWGITQIIYDIPGAMETLWGKAATLTVNGTEAQTFHYVAGEGLESWMGAGLWSALVCVCIVCIALVMFPKYLQAIKTLVTDKENEKNNIYGYLLFLCGGTAVLACANSAMCATLALVTILLMVGRYRTKELVPKPMKKHPMYAWRRQISFVLVCVICLGSVVKIVAQQEKVEAEAQSIVQSIYAAVKEEQAKGKKYAYYVYKTEEVEQENEKGKTETVTKQVDSSELMAEYQYVFRNESTVESLPSNSSYLNAVNNGYNVVLISNNELDETSGIDIYQNAWTKLKDGTWIYSNDSDIIKNVCDNLGSSLEGHGDLGEPVKESMYVRLTNIKTGEMLGVIDGWKLGITEYGTTFWYEYMEDGQTGKFYFGNRGFHIKYAIYEKGTMCHLHNSAFHLNLRKMSDGTYKIVAPDINYALGINLDGSFVLKDVKDESTKWKIEKIDPVDKSSEFYLEHVESGKMLSMGLDNKGDLDDSLIGSNEKTLFRFTPDAEGVAGTFRYGFSNRYFYVSDEKYEKDTKVILNESPSKFEIRKVEDGIYQIVTQDTNYAIGLNEKNQLTLLKVTNPNTLWKISELED